MVIYVDVIFLTNTLMTVAIIWVLGKLLALRTCWWRLLVAAGCGLVYTFLVLYLQALPWIYSVKFIVYLLLNLVTAVLMILTAFPGLSPSTFLKAVAYLYIVTFIAMGGLLFLLSASGYQDPGFNQKIMLLGLTLCFLFLLGQSGWLFFRDYLQPDVFYLPVTIIIKGHTFKIRGLVDTGNRLNDPLTGFPVIVVNLEVIIGLFSERPAREFREAYQLINHLQERGLGKRVRILPFYGLGQEHGLLAGLRPDRVIIEYRDSRLDIRETVLGLSPGKLDQNNGYQALINPELLA